MTELHVAGKIRNSGCFLTTSVVGARNLAVADTNGLSDPYAVLQLGKSRKKTKIIKKTLNPSWNESFDL